MKLRRITGAGGAEITGVDLTDNPGDNMIAEIRAAILQYGVVTIPDQKMDDAALACFSERLGPFGVDPYVEGEETHPNVIAVVKEATDKGLNFGGNWHSDWSFQETPPSFTLLHARELPPYGGDTLFSNQQMVWESLSKGMQEMLSRLRGIHSAGFAYGPKSAFATGNFLKGMKIKTSEDALAEYAHPLARKHAETGKTALYINKVYTRRIEDMSEAESLPLLNYLFEQSARPEFTVRVSWKPEQLTIWDNRSVMHQANPDYDMNERRFLYRLMLKGEVPV